MKYLSTILFLLLCKSAFSQDIVEQFREFNGFITVGSEGNALALAEKIIPGVSGLSVRKQAIFYYNLGNLHESRKNTEQAIDFYERSLKLEPNYYVPHLALGYLYLKKANILVPKINGERSNMVLHKQYLSEYSAWMRKARPHLEKALACDPNEQVLSTIKSIYKSLKDDSAIISLDLRLKSLENDCVSVLTEE